MAIRGGSASGQRGPRAALRRGRAALAGRPRPRRPGERQAVHDLERGRRHRDRRLYGGRHHPSARRHPPAGAQLDSHHQQGALRRPGQAGGRSAPDQRRPVHASDLVPDQRMVLAKNPHYWGEVATAPDEVIIRWMKEPVVALTAALGGEVDMTTPLPPNLIASLGGNVRALEVPSGVIYFLGLGAVGPL